MTNPTLSDPALDVVALIYSLIYSSEVLKSMVDGHPDLLDLFVKAAHVAAEDKLRSRAFFGAVARAVYESDRAVEIMCSGDGADLTEQMLLASRANEDLGRLLKQLVPTAVPIGDDATSSPAN